MLAGALRDGFELVAVHEYRGTNGAAQFWKVRAVHPDGRKAIRPMHRSGDRFEMGEPPAPAAGRPLYRLDELAARPGEPVIVCEGESCADALAALGLLATTSGGADSAGRADWGPLAGRDVLIWPDADEAGARYGAAVAERLAGLNCRVRVLDVAALDLPPKGDAVDWLAARDSVTDADVLALATVDPPRAADTDATSWPAPLDLPALLREEPAPPRMIIDSWLPAGYATLLAGHGGSGKSSIALNLAACLVTGRPFFGLAVERRRVLYASCEDRAAVLHWRMARICQHAGIDPDELSDLAVLDLVGHDALLLRRIPGGGLLPTPAYAELQATIERVGAEVLIVDGSADTFGGNENDRGEVRQFVHALVRLVPVAGAVVLLHHVAKATAGGGFGEGYSGSTAWHNSARARWYLRPEHADGEPGGGLLLELAKTNHGSGGHAVRIEWDAAAHTFSGRSMTPASRVERHVRDEAERDAVLSAIRAITAAGDYVPAAATGNRTALHVLSAVPGFPSELCKSTHGKRRFLSHIETLRRMGQLREGSIRRGNRHATATLEPANAPR
jgi:RecA-family ATPase